MSNELARIQSGSVIPSADEWGTIYNMARSLLPTGFLPNTIKTPEQATAIILKGRELNIPPMYALSNIVVIQGKPACSAELLQALVYRDHGDDALRFVESTNDACTIEYRRRSWKKPERYTFTLADADRAGLMKNPTWRSYPAAMLRARCLSAVARMAFADSIGGMYTPEEIGASVRVVDGVVELDESSVIDVTSDAPQTAQIAPERDETDDAITSPAMEKIRERAAERGLTAEDLAVLVAYLFDVERLEELTVNQGREFYRYLHHNKTPNGELQIDVEAARRADLQRREFDTGDLPPDDIDTRNDSEYEEVAMFNAAHADRFTN